MRIANRRTVLPRELARAACLTLAVGLAAIVPATNDANAVQTSCGGHDFAGPYADAFLAGKPFSDAGRASETILTMADAVCHHDVLLKRLADALGPVVGYKAAATSPGAQKQLGLDAPVLGVLYQDMLREDGATVAIDEGARLIFELDLMARVGDESLNAATTREDAFAGIDAFVPFVELGDLMVPMGEPINGQLLQAMNAGARLGVTGTPIPLEGLSEDAIAEATGTLKKDGTVVAQAPATALLGHPLDAVLWIVDAADKRGLRLKKGDLLSLGSLGRFQMATPGKIEATYEGFSAEPATVQLTLE